MLCINKCYSSIFLVLLSSIRYVRRVIFYILCLVTFCCVPTDSDTMGSDSTEIQSTINYTHDITVFYFCWFCTDLTALFVKDGQLVSRNNIFNVL